MNDFEDIVATFAENIAKAKTEFIVRYGIEPTDALIPSDRWAELRRVTRLGSSISINGLECHEWYAPVLVVCITNKSTP